MQLLFCGSGWRSIVDRIRARLPDGSSIQIWDRAVPLIDAIGEIDVLLPSNAHITDELVAAAPRLRLIQQPAAGTEGIARTAAIARGIPICNAPGANHVAVAEAALFLLLALARRLPVAQRQLEARVVGEPVGIELAGKTLGIIGPGRSGTALADRARALGMTVRMLGRGASADERVALFAGSHMISIHCPLTPDTRGLVGAAELAALPRGAFVVNMSRGGVVDRAALEAALASGHLGGVGLDVHREEPPDLTEPLYRDPRVVALPHIAGSTEEAFDRIVTIVVDNVARIARGEPVSHRVA